MGERASPPGWGLAKAEGVGRRILLFWRCTALFVSKLVVKELVLGVPWEGAASARWDQSHKGQRWKLGGGRHVFRAFMSTQPVSGPEVVAVETSSSSGVGTYLPAPRGLW